MKPVDFPLALALAILLPCQQAAHGEPKKEASTMTQEQASAFARLALKGIHKEYPNKPADVLNDDGDIKGPRLMHPAFYGCFDWHSSVHAHWMLVRLLRLHPDLPEKNDIRAALTA